MEREDKSQITPDNVRDERGPGAHSGQESRPQERIIPGTASATEGYEPEGGTRDHEPIKGLEMHHEEAEAARRSTEK
jgi:hypothetical protein